MTSNIRALKFPDAANAYNTRPVCSYKYSTVMVRTPDTSHTLVDTLHRFRNPLQLLPARIPQKLCLLRYLAGLHISYANDLMASIDVVARYHRVLVGSWRDGYLDLGVGGSESF